jgi:hypothetical protein
MLSTDTLVTFMRALYLVGTRALCADAEKRELGCVVAVTGISAYTHHRKKIDGN